jgi:hypothetical protein
MEESCTLSVPLRQIEHLMRKAKDRTVRRHLETHRLIARKLQTQRTQNYLANAGYASS